MEHAVPVLLGDSKATFEHVDDDDGVVGLDLHEVSLTGFSSVEDKALSEVSLTTGNDSGLLTGSAGSLNSGSFGLGNVSGGVLRGGTLGLWYTTGRFVVGSVLELVLTSTCICGHDLLVDRSPEEVSAVSFVATASC